LDKKGRHIIRLEKKRRKKSCLCLLFPGAEAKKALSEEKSKSHDFPEEERKVIFSSGTDYFLLLFGSFL
jgi:hypothetical protein